MKTGKTLSQLAQEVERIENSKKDFIAPTTKLHMVDGHICLDGMPETFKANDNFHSQVAARLKIPKQYYDRMKTENSSLLDVNVNHWLHSQPEKRMIRTLDGNARAFLSDRYRALDNYDMMSAVLPVLQEMPNIKIVSSDITDKKLYLKVLFPEIEAKIEGSKQVGDLVQAGICISNSEIGQGSLAVQPLIYRLVCTNGMIRNSSMKKYHVGKGNGTGFEDIQELLTDETKRLSDKAFWMSVQDIVRSSVNRDLFMNDVARLSETTQDFITNDDVIEVVKNTCNHFGIGLADERKMLTSLLKDNDFSRWGLANAVTNIANDQEDYEAATEFEKIGGKIIDLSRQDWKSIAC